MPGDRLEPLGDARQLADGALQVGLAPRRLRGAARGRCWPRSRVRADTAATPSIWSRSRITRLLLPAPRSPRCGGRGRRHRWVAGDDVVERLRRVGGQFLHAAHRLLPRSISSEIWRPGPGSRPPARRPRAPPGRSARPAARTSSATTANPRPCWPARAASIAALSAMRLVRSAISRIVPMKPISRGDLVQLADLPRGGRHEAAAAEPAAGSRPGSDPDCAPPRLAGRGRRPSPRPPRRPPPRALARRGPRSPRGRRATSCSCSAAPPRIAWAVGRGRRRQRRAATVGRRGQRANLLADPSTVSTSGRRSSAMWIAVASWRRTWSRPRGPSCRRCAACGGPVRGCRSSRSPKRSGSTSMLSACGTRAPGSARPAGHPRSRSARRSRDRLRPQLRRCRRRITASGPAQCAAIGHGAGAPHGAGRCGSRPSRAAGWPAARAG